MKVEISVLFPPIEMNNATVNFSKYGTNSTTQSFEVVTILDMFVYSIHLSFGLPTNCYVLWLIINRAGGGIASEFFRINQCVCEIVYCLDSLFCLICSNYPWLSRLLELTWFLLGLGVTGRPLFQCLICVERYLAVVHPVIFLKYKPLRYRVICSTVAWIITLGSCLCFVFRLISFNIYICVCFFSIQFSLLLSIQLFCCLAVLRALKQSGPGERIRDRNEENHMKRRAFYLILITTVSLTIIYVPFTIAGFSFILTRQYCGELFTAVFFCFVLAGFLQPVLYLHRTGKLSCLCFQ